LLDLIALKKRQKGKKREYSQHNENTNMVTNLKAMSFRSDLSIPFTAPGFFASSRARVVVVWSVMVGWLCTTPHPKNDLSNEREAAGWGIVMILSDDYPSPARLDF
jgi:hypothetical protein